MKKMSHTITLPVTVIDENEDGMNGTEIQFSLFDSVLKDVQNEEWREKIFPSVEFLCGENKFTCKGEYDLPNYTREVSFEIQGKTYKCTPECTAEEAHINNDACTFQIECPNDSCPMSMNTKNIKNLEQKIDTMERKFHSMFNYVMVHFNKHRHHDDVAPPQRSDDQMDLNDDQWTPNSKLMQIYTTR